MNEASQELLILKNIITYFPLRSNFFQTPKRVNAINDVSLSISPGRTLGLVGESGCGKSTLGRVILKLIEPNSGQIIFDNTDITHFDFGQMKKIRSKMQIIFQDPYASLNPRMTIHDILKEPIVIHNFCEKKDRDKYINTLLDYVQLSQDCLTKYPHEFSGGQRQRICIARALALKPKLIVCDESVSALDVSIQAQVINLLMDLQKEFNLTYLFISHDLKVVQFIAHDIAVMYLGKIVETGRTENICTNPKHPYTKALMSAMPSSQVTDRTSRIILQGSLPSPVDLPKGCFFSTRCWRATARCKESHPEITTENNHSYSCYHPIKKTDEIPNNLANNANN